MSFNPAEIRQMMDEQFRSRADSEHGQGYSDWRDTAFANPSFVRALFDELKLTTKLYARAARKAAPVSVYFVQRGQGGPIKIGATRNFDKRLKTLATSAAESLNVIAVIPGSFQLESDIHYELCDHALEGEWFAPAKEVWHVIDREIRNQNTDVEV